MRVVDLAERLGLFADHWQPKVVGRFNGHDLMVVKVQGEFVWHVHADSDDFFLVLKGHLTVDMPDGSVDVHPGQVFVVPRGVSHRPRAAVETHLLLIEPAGLPNTGDPETAAAKVAV